MGSPGDREVPPSSVRWGQLGERNEAETLLSCGQSHDGIAALGEMAVLLFGIQIVKHIHLCTPPSLDRNLIKSFDLFLRQKTLPCEKTENAGLSVTYYNFKGYVIIVKQFFPVYSTISYTYAELNKLLSTLSIQKS